jgi:hypothetical protein
VRRDCRWLVLECQHADRDGPRGWSGAGR